MKKMARYGSWKSPVTPEYVSGKERSITRNLQMDGDDVYFIEMRPDERGRMVLMRLTLGGTAEEVLPPEFNVRTRYLEYSGLSFLVADKTAYFVNFADQEIYVAGPGQTPRRLTNEAGNRFADFILDKRRNRLLALREVPAQPESKNSICAIDLTTGKVEDLVTGADFYNCVRIHGDRVLWISWNHPNMPWNGTELWTADLNDLNNRRKVAGDSEHAVAQARFAPDGQVHFVAELDNFLRLYRHTDAKPERVFGVDGEFALPDWVPGTQQYAFTAQGLCSAVTQHGRWKLLLKDKNGKVSEAQSDFPLVASLDAHGDTITAIVSHSDRASSIVAIQADGAVKELYSPAGTLLDPAYISKAEEIRFATEDGQQGYAWFYPPANADFTTEGEKPPLLVFAHGGPTAFSFCAFQKSIQFWTTRGYAVVDVNYGGSTGYGRAYRERLRGKWGLVDVTDCVAAVKFLAAKNLIDPGRVAIRGGSAGGYTTLAALTFTRGIFAVGASYFGVSDPELLAKETHKLESRYLDQLIGPYPAALEIYKARSPIEHVGRLNCPIIFFQGDEDKVVPPNQSELMYELLKKKGIPAQYHLYAQEGHGFVRSETNQHSLKAEHAFYAQVFGFEVQTEDRNI